MKPSPSSPFAKLDPKVVAEFVAAVQERSRALTREREDNLTSCEGHPDLKTPDLTLRD
jgi:hypothetical protein